MTSTPGRKGFVNIEGNRFGRLVALCFDRKPNGKAAWRCACDCGCEAVIDSDKLTSGHTRSCGCLGREMAGIARRTHGFSGTPEHRAWKAAKKRCYNRKDASYCRYGELGIEVCARWRGSSGFSNFLSDMGLRPSPKHSLDRYPDPNGHYAPDNCRWATILEQNNNRRDNVVLEFGGQSKTLSEWAREKGLNYKTLLMRLELGWPLDEAFHKPISSDRRFKRTTTYLTVNGETLSVGEWSRLVGLSIQTIHYRMRAGWEPFMVVAPLVRARSTA